MSEREGDPYHRTSNRIIHVQNQDDNDWPESALYSKHSTNFYTSNSIDCGSGRSFVKSEKNTHESFVVCLGVSRTIGIVLSSVFGTWPILANKSQDISASMASIVTIVFIQAIYIKSS